MPLLSSSKKLFLICATATFFVLAATAAAAPTYVNKPGALPSPCYMTPPAPGPTPTPPPSTTLPVPLPPANVAIPVSSTAPASSGTVTLQSISATEFRATITGVSGGRINVFTQASADPNFAWQQQVWLGSLPAGTTQFLVQKQANQWLRIGVENTAGYDPGKSVPVPLFDTTPTPGTPPPTPTPTPGTPTPPPGTTNPYSPYIWLQAENYTTMQGVVRSTDITDLDTGDNAKYTAVNFGAQGARGFIAHLGAPAAQAGGILEIRLDSLTATPVARLQTVSTGNWGTYTYQSAGTYSLITGVHDVYLTFEGQEVGALNAFGFTRTTPANQNPPAPVPPPPPPPASPVTPTVPPPGPATPPGSVNIVASLRADVPFASQTTAGNVQYGAAGGVNVTTVDDTIGGGITGPGVVNGSNVRFGKINVGGRTVIQSSAGTGDPGWYGGPARTDVQTSPSFYEGDTYWLAIEQMVPSSLYGQSGTYFVPWDAHGSPDGGWSGKYANGSNAFMFQIIRNSMGDYTDYPLAQYVQGDTFHKFVVRAKLSTANGQARTQLWIDGVLRVDSTEANAAGYPQYMKAPAAYQPPAQVFTRSSYVVADSAQQYTEPQIRGLLQ